MNCDLVFINDIETLLQANMQLKTDCFIIAQPFMSIKQAIDLKKELEATKLNFKLCHVMMRPNSKEITAFRQVVDLIAFVGGTVQANKFAVSTKGIDILLNPTSNKKFEFDQNLAHIAQENDVKIGFLFSEILNTKGFSRMKTFRNYAFVCNLLKKYKVKTFFFSGARHEFELRSSKDLRAFYVMLGFKKEQAFYFEKNAIELIFEKPKLFEVIKDEKPKA